LNSDFEFSSPAFKTEDRFTRFVVRGRQTHFDVQRASGFLSRLRGWLGYREAPLGAGLLLTPCDAVHTFAMRFPIDIVFVDGAGRVLLVDHAVPAWRIKVCLGAQSVIELPAGRAAWLGLEPGAWLQVRS